MTDPVRATLRAALQEQIEEHWHTWRAARGLVDGDMNARLLFEALPSTKRARAAVERAAKEAG